MVKGAHPGNDYAAVLKDPEMRQRAFRSFCQHIADGYPIKAWSYREGNDGCIWRTMLKFIEQNPNDFHLFLKDEAHCLSYKKWFDKGVKLTDGLVKGNPSPQTYALMMRNMFKWDHDQKPETNSTAGLRELIQMHRDLYPASSAKTEKDKESEEDRSCSTTESCNPGPSDQDL